MLGKGNLPHLKGGRVEGRFLEEFFIKRRRKSFILKKQSIIQIWGKVEEKTLSKKEETRWEKKKRRYLRTVGNRQFTKKGK